MSSPAAPEAKLNSVMQRYWQEAWDRITKTCKKKWQAVVSRNTDKAWNIVFQATDGTSAVKIIEWYPDCPIRNVLSWIEDNETLVVAIRPSKESFKEAKEIIRDWVSLNGTQF